MKKLLFASTALAFGTLVGTAQAAEPIQLSVGGYMWWWGQVSTQDEDFMRESGLSANNFDVIGDGEIHFTGSTTLDNGLEIGVTVELEGGNRSEGDPIDESFITVGGSFGEVTIGAEDGVNYRLGIDAIWAEVEGWYAADTYIYEAILVPSYYNGPVLDLAGNPVQPANFTFVAKGDGNDANKISYVSPAFFGLTLGASWTPGADGDASGGSDISPLQNQSFNYDGFGWGNVVEEQWEVIATYENSFGSVDFGTSVGYVNINAGGSGVDANGEQFDAERVEQISYGAYVGTGGFMLAGGYKLQHHPTRVGGGLAPGDQDGYAWNIAGMYGAGPWRVSLGYHHSSIEGTQGPIAVGFDDDNNNDVRDPGEDFILVDDDQDTDIVVLSGAYDIGPGVTTFASIGWAQFESEVDDNELPGAETLNNEGWALMTGIALSF